MHYHSFEYMCAYIYITILRMRMNILIDEVSSYMHEEITRI